jgi:hypothetical protein
MYRDLIRYTKFVGAPHPAVRQAAWTYLHDLGLFDVEILSPVEALELAKLIETSYEALLIGWAQELDRFARAVGMGVTSEMILALTEEVPYLPDVSIPQSGFLVVTLHISPWADVPLSAFQVRKHHPSAPQHLSHCPENAPFVPFLCPLHPPPLLLASCSPSIGIPGRQILGSCSCIPYLALSLH